MQESHRDINTSSSPQVRYQDQQPTDEDRITSQTQQQQQTTEANNHSDDSYSSDFSSISSADEVEHQPQEHQEQVTQEQLHQTQVFEEQVQKTQELPHRTPTADCRRKSRPGTAGSAAVRNTQQHGRSSALNTASSSHGVKPSRTGSTVSGRVEGSPTRSRARQRLGRGNRKSEPRPGQNVRKENDVKVRSKILQGKEESGLELGHDSEKNDEGCDGTGSRSSSTSSSSTSQHLHKESPPRQVDFHSPVRTNPSNHEFHLKYTDNDDIRKWLRSKNSEMKRQRKEKRRLERTRCREMQDEQLAKEERRKQSEMLVQRWMEEKRIETRMLKKRQQQSPKTLEQPQQGTKPAQDQGGKNSVTTKDGKSNVPLFSRLGKYDSFPGARTWTTPGKKTSEVERRKAYGDWLRRNETGGFSSKDREKLAFVGNDHEDKTKTSAFQCVPHPPSEKDRRCASAVAGRRRKGEVRSTSLQTRRPLSSKIDRMGTRLEPQGADGFDPVPELENTLAVSKPKQDSAENTTAGLEVEDMEETPEKDSCHNIVPHVSSEFDDKRILDSIPDAARQDDDVQSGSEDRKIGEEVPRTPGPQMRSSRELLNIIRSESRSEPVDGGTTGSKDCSQEHQQSSPVEHGTREDEEHSQDHREEEKPRPSSEDGQEKTLDVARTSDAESAISSSGGSTSIRAMDDNVIDADLLP